MIERNGLQMLGKHRQGEAEEFTSQIARQIFLEGWTIAKTSMLDCRSSGSRNNQVVLCSIAKKSFTNKGRYYPQHNNP